MRKREPGVLGPARFCLFSLGISTAAFGVAITASVFTLALRQSPASAQVMEAEPPASIALRVSAVPSDHELEAMAGESAMLVEAAAPRLLTDSGLHDVALSQHSVDAGVAGLTPSIPRIAFATPADAVRIRALGLSDAPQLPAPSTLPQVAAAPAAVTAVPTLAPAVITVPTAALATPEPIVVHAVEDVGGVRRIRDVNVTFYDCMNQGFCGRMANGRKVYEGAAACSYDLPLGTRFYIVDDPTNRIYQCDDRGLLSRTWVDIFWNDPRDGWRWQDAVGRWGTIVIVAWGDE
ncbi:MAG TPA: hypothetical protein VH951_09010 [Dehalococcoidia bacterium]